MQAMGEPTSAGGFAIYKLIGWPLIVAIFAAVVSMALTPPASRNEFGARILVTVPTSIIVGPFAIEYFNFGAYSYQAQLGVVFLTGVPAWLVLAVITGALNKWRGKSLGEISDEVKKLRDGV